VVADCAEYSIAPEADLRAARLETRMSGCTALFVAWLALALHTADPEAPIAAEKLRRALGLIEYVAADYIEAVGEDGHILDAEEFAEQGRLLAEAESLLLELPRTGRSGLRGEMRGLLTACNQGRPPRDVVPRARRLHAHLERVFSDVPLAPRQIPSLAAGKLLYVQACAICHGDDGRARTARARALQPAPRDFGAAMQDERLSPYRAFNAVTFGVPGTSMASFETLDEAERWDLAFWVLALRHPAPPAIAAAAHQAGIPAPTLRDLTFATDADLELLLDGLASAARPAQVARWRWSLPHVLE